MINACESEAGAHHNIKTMKIYISGKITGLNEKEAFKLFEEAEKNLVKEVFIDYSVINPMKLPHNHDKSWESFMAEDIKALLTCNAIYLLKNWVNSKGARIEYLIATELGLTKIFE